VLRDSVSTGYTGMRNSETTRDSQSIRDSIPPKVSGVNNDAINKLKNNVLPAPTEPEKKIGFDDDEEEADKDVEKPIGMNNDEEDGEEDDTRPSMRGFDDNNLGEKFKTIHKDEYNIDRDSTSSVRDSSLVKLKSTRNDGETFSLDEDGTNRDSSNSPPVYTIPSDLITTINENIDQVTEDIKTARYIKDWSYIPQIQFNVQLSNTRQQLEQRVESINETLKNIVLLLNNLELTPEVYENIMKELIDISDSKNITPITPIMPIKTFYCDKYNEIIVTLYNNLYNIMKNIPQLQEKFTEIKPYSKGTLLFPKKFTGGNKSIKRTYKNKRKTRRPSKSSRTRRTNSPRNKKYYY